MIFVLEEVILIRADSGAVPGLNAEEGRVFGNLSPESDGVEIRVRGFQPFSSGVQKGNLMYTGTVEPEGI